MGELRKKEEYQRQVELKRQAEKAQEEPNRAQMEAELKRKTQEGEDEAKCLAAEADILESSTVDNPENLENRLGDFDDESEVEGEKSSILSLSNTDIKKQVHSKALPIVKDNVLPNQAQ